MTTTSYGAVSYNNLNNLTSNAINNTSRKTLNVLQQSVVVHSNNDYGRRNDAVVVKQTKKSIKCTF